MKVKGAVSNVILSSEGLFDLLKRYPLYLVEEALSIVELKNLLVRAKRNVQEPHFDVHLKPMLMSSETHPRWKPARSHEEMFPTDLESSFAIMLSAMGEKNWFCRRGDVFYVD